MSDMKLSYGIYRWDGGCGAVFKSRENHVVMGTVRLIADELFYAYSVYERKIFSKAEVCWCFVDRDKNAPAYIREFMRKVFCNS